MDLTLRTDTFGAEDQTWLGSAHGLQSADSITLDGTTLGAVFTDGKVPSGVVLGKITSTGLYGPYDDAASDGRQVARYLLLQTTQLNNPLRGDASTTFHNVQASGVWHGQVIAAKLPRSTANGTVGGADAAAQVDLKNINFV